MPSTASSGRCSAIAASTRSRRDRKTARATQVAVVVTAGERLRQCELVERGREVVQEPFRACEQVGERRRRDDPAQSQRGRERLRDRPELDYVPRREPLQRAHRLAVVTKLHVQLERVDGALAARPTFRAVTPTWQAGDTIFPGPGRIIRVLGV
jgi:hypothetical protein